MSSICLATKMDKEDVLSLYKIQLGREYCPWDDEYPNEETIDFDLSRDSLFVMKDGGRIVAAITIDDDEAINSLSCWDKALSPGGELFRLAVLPDMQNKGIARKMFMYGMEILRKRGFKSIHILVNKLNTPAIRSYEVFSLRNVGECHMFDQDFICYEKELSDISEWQSK